MTEPGETIIEQGSLLQEEWSKKLDDQLVLETTHPLLQDFTKQGDSDRHALEQVAEQLLLDMGVNLLFGAPDRPELFEDLNREVVRGKPSPHNDFKGDPDRSKRTIEAGSLLVAFAKQDKTNPDKWRLSSGAYDANIYYQVMNVLGAYEERK